MSARPLISAVIPTRDRAPLLRASLESLARQTLPSPRFEVVVIDDGSADDTAFVCQSFVDRLQLQYHRIAPSGISAAKNLGIFAASAPILLFFDDDDVAHEDLLLQHLTTHEEHPEMETAVLGLTEWSPELDVTDLMRYLTDIGKFLFDYTQLEHGAVLDYTFFWGGRSSCKRVFLATEGIFDPAFRFGSEDIELGYRLQRKGLKVIYNADALSHMNRTVTFEEFCRRCERQGRSQHHFGVELHGDDPEVRRYCDIDGAAARWEECQRELPGIVARVEELELLLADGAHEATERWREELFALYGRAFRAFRLKGLTEAGSV